MKKCVVSLLLAVFSFVPTSFGQCNAFWTHSVQAFEVQFTNQSTLANARYYWNFGDGTTSFYSNPRHRFPANGRYLVSLFAKDTVNNCADFHEEWITVLQQELDGSVPFVKDSTTISTSNGEEIVTLVDECVGCGNCLVVMDVGSGGNMPYGNWCRLGSYGHARFVSRGMYSCADSVAGQGWNYTNKTAYRSTVHQYDAAKSYGSCSADFEFSVAQEDSAGQRILFSAMNKNAASYLWVITGFGDPIYSTHDTVSQFYRFYPWYPDGVIGKVMLATIGQSGCRDTLWQALINRPTSVTTAGVALRPSSVTVYPNPFTSMAVIEIPAGDGEASLVLFNAWGQVVRRISRVTDGRGVIKRGDLPAGVYYFTVEWKKGGRSHGRITAQ